MIKDYGYRKTNPDYWMQVSTAIWNDPGLTQDEKMTTQGELVQLYQTEKRDKSARENARKGPSNLDPNNEAIKKAEEYSRSIQNPNFKKHK